MTHGDKESTAWRNNRALQSRRGCVLGEGEAAAQGERQGPTTGPVLGAASIPIAHSRDFRYNPKQK